MVFGGKPAPDTSRFGIREIIVTAARSLTGSNFSTDLKPVGLIALVDTLPTTML